MTEQEKKGNVFALIVSWFLLPLTVVLLCEGFRIPEQFARWVDGGF